jgi:hypothetical protein
MRVTTGPSILGKEVKKSAGGISWKKSKSAGGSTTGRGYLGATKSRWTIYDDMTAKSQALGRQIADELALPGEAGKLATLNSELDKKFGIQDDRYIVATIDTVRNRSTGGTNWRQLADHAWHQADMTKDEFISTATILDMLSGMTDAQLQSQGVREAMKLFSRARLPTRQVGYFIKGTGEDFQHPTDARAYFAKPATKHGRHDIARRQAILAVGQRNDISGAARVKEIFSTGITETLNKMAAPVRAQNILLRIPLDSQQTSAASKNREGIKGMWESSSETQLGQQSETAIWARGATSSRSPSPMRI